MCCHKYCNVDFCCSSFHEMVIAFQFLQCIILLGAIGFASKIDFSSSQNPFMAYLKRIYLMKSTALILLSHKNEHLFVE